MASDTLPSETGNVIISVIVIAHDRRQFLKLALESLVNQSVDKSMYEVIIVKNFEDCALDRYAFEHSMVSILTNEINAGRKISIGIKASRGKIVCMLADDDLFSPNKLEKVLYYFNTVSNLVYYHNAFATIDLDGKEIKIPYYLNPQETIFSFNEKIDLNVISKMVKYKGYHNDSSISILKKFYLPYLKELESLKASWDIFFFFLSFAKGSVTLIDSDILTKFRVHNSMSQFSGDYEKFLSRRVELALTYINEYGIIESLISDNDLRDYLKYNGLGWKVIYQMLSQRKHSKFSLSDYLTLLRYFRYYMPQGRLLTLIGLFMSTCFGSISSKLYFYYNNLSRKY